MQSFDKRYNHQRDIQSIIYSFFTCKSMVFTNKLLLCNWESYLVSQLYWLKGPYNRFQTHKRFKRLKFTKAMFWYYCFENKTDDSQPIGSFSPLGGKQSDWPIRLLSLLGGGNNLIGCSFWVSTHLIGQKMK